MAIIAPFKGLMFNEPKLGDISKLVAPPYDVINEEEQDEYYKTHPNNVIRLILGKKKTGDTDLDNRYTRAADHFKKWQAEETLVPNKRPAMYVTSLEYDPEDGKGSRTRWGLMGVVRIEDKDTGVILPHERTFSAHKDDRLKLMRSCNAQFSQIFGLYEDHQNKILGFFKDVIQEEPIFSFKFKDGTSHKVWSTEDPFIFKKVAKAMEPLSIFIADGHHRYETSRNFRNLMRARHGNRPSDRSYEFVNIYLSNMDDPGLTILPTHRLIKQCPDFQIKPFLERIKEWFDIESFSCSSPFTEAELEDLEERLSQNGKLISSFGFYHKGSKELYLLTLKTRQVMEEFEDLHDCIRELDVIVLSRLIFQKGLEFTKDDLDKDEIFQYDSNMKSSVSRVNSGEVEMAFLLNPTNIEQVKEVARNGLIMPRKSTFFYPKTLTGLIFNKIDPNEIIQAP